MTTQYKRTWFPAHTQIGLTDGVNTSRLHSLWVGVTAPILNLPTMVWQMVMMPLLFGIFSLFKLIAISVYYGASGNVIGTSPVESIDRAQPNTDL